jgi:acyl-CoA thioester hydrolase
MPKTKLRAKPDYSFQYHTYLKIRDINYANHLSNDAVVSLINEARIDMFNKIGCAEFALGDPHTGIVIADLVVNYKKQGYLGDEIIIHSDIDEIEQKGFRIFFKIQRGDDLMVLAETGVVVFDYQAGNITTVPKIFLEALKQLQLARISHEHHVEL